MNTILRGTLASAFCCFGSIPDWCHGQDEEGLIADFHRIYQEKFYQDGAWHNSFLGITTMQYPGDMLATAELIYAVNPDVIVETGCAFGGSALFYASILRAMEGAETGKVLTIDVDFERATQAQQHSLWKEHVIAIQGSSTAEEVIAQVRRLCAGKRVLVILDSAHFREHVSRELELYAPLVSEGSYLVVSDTHFNGHPLPRIEKYADGGPFEAVSEFLATQPGFEPDRGYEKHLVTACPRGFLRRVGI